MIPEAATTRECKLAVLEHCSVLPEIGEIYAIEAPAFNGSIPFGSRWRVMEPYQDGEVTFKTMLGDSWQSVDLAYWLSLVKYRKVRFIGYDP